MAMIFSVGPLRHRRHVSTMGLITIHAAEAGCPTLVWPVLLIDRRTTPPIVIANPSKNTINRAVVKKAYS